MSVIGSNILAGASAQGGGGYTIDQSLRFNDNDSAYLSRTPASAGNRRTFTFSAWVKLGSATGSLALFSSRSSLDTALFRFNNSAIQYYTRDSGGTVTANYISTSLYRDPSAWYQVILSIDSTQATASNRIKIFVNGSEVPLTASTTMAQNLETRINTAVEHSIATQTTQAEYFDGYLSEVHFIDGSALTPDYFGETDEDYGHWKPIAYEGTYGNNGCYLDFSNSASIGEDQAGSNDWTANNLAATDVVLDSPTNNFCTLNPLVKILGSPTYSEGNLQFNGGSGSGDDLYRGSIGTGSSGKWYFECCPKTLSGSNVFLVGASYDTGTNGAEGAYNQDGRIFNQSVSVVATVATYTTADVIGIAIDVDNGTINYYKNNSLQGSSSFTAGSNMFPSGRDNSFNVEQAVFNFGQDSSFAGNKTAQNNTDDNGVGDFYYAPPSGFLALCTANLSDPAVVPGENFNTVLYTGNGSTNAISGVGFQPDWVWIKERNNVRSHLLFDAVRGAAKYLHSDSTDAETNAAGRLDSFDSDGFTLGGHVTTNESGYNYVSWNWKADNTSGSSNTDGSITSTVAANPDAGFSIVSYTGNGTNGATIGHGLSENLDCVIIKDRSGAESWAVAHSGAGVTGDTIGGLAENYMLVLNSTASKSNNGSLVIGLNNSSYFAVGHAVEVNQSGHNYLAYCFHSVDGFSKFGSYTGNGSTDGPFVYTGFRPAMVILKNSTTGGTDWLIYDDARDPDNEVGLQLYPNRSGAEGGPYDGLDFLSNGFKIRGTQGVTNQSGNTLIYMAFAEFPTKFANAR